jgi:hypothetical protein
LILAAMLIGVLFYVWNSTVFRISEPEVLGLKRITNQDVNAVLEIEDQPIFAMDPTQMELDLKNAFPEFSTVAIKVSLPATVVVSVTERTPVLIWKQGGRSVLVDAEGISFPIREGSAAGTYPTVEASSSPPLIDPDAILKTVAQDVTADTISQAQAPVIEKKEVPDHFMTPEMVFAILTLANQAPQKTPLLYNATHGLGWKDGRGWDVYFGDSRDIEMKLRVYKTIVKQLKNEGLQPILISVEFVHSPYYRLEN